MNTAAVTATTSTSATAPTTLKWLDVRDAGELEVNDAASELLRQHGLLNLVMVFGQMGEGKSTLMNALAECDIFLAQESAAGVTRGVDLATEFLRPHPEAPDAPMLAFCDVEGQGDSLGRGVEAKLAAPLLLTSKIIIMNIMTSGSRVPVTELENLKLLVRLAQMCKGATSEIENIFGHLHIVFRDVDETITTEATARETLLGMENVRKVRGGLSAIAEAKERNELRDDMEHFFESTQVWCLPRPSMGGFNGKLCDATAKFQAKISAVREAMMEQLRQPKMFFGEPLDGSTLAPAMAELVQTLNGAKGELDALINPATLLQSVKQRIADDAVADAKADAQAGIDSIREAIGREDGNPVTADKLEELWVSRVTSTQRVVTLTDTLERVPAEMRDAARANFDEFLGGQRAVIERENTELADAQWQRADGRMKAEYDTCVAKLKEEADNKVQEVSAQSLPSGDLHQLLEKLENDHMDALSRALASAHHVGPLDGADLALQAAAFVGLVHRARAIDRAKALTQQFQIGPLALHRERLSGANSATAHRERAAKLREETEERFRELGRIHDQKVEEDEARKEAEHAAFQKQIVGLNEVMAEGRRQAEKLRQEHEDLNKRVQEGAALAQVAEAWTTSFASAMQHGPLDDEEFDAWAGLCQQKYYGLGAAFDEMTVEGQQKIASAFETFREDHEKTNYEASVQHNNALAERLEAEFRADANDVRALTLRPSTDGGGGQLGECETNNAARAEYHRTYNKWSEVTEIFLAGKRGVEESAYMPVERLTKNVRLGIEGLREAVFGAAFINKQIVESRLGETTRLCPHDGIAYTKEAGCDTVRCGFMDWHDVVADQRTADHVPVPGRGSDGKQHGCGNKFDWSTASPVADGSLRAFFQVTAPEVEIGVKPRGFLSAAGAGFKRVLRHWSYASE